MPKRLTAGVAAICLVAVAGVGLTFYAYHARTQPAAGPLITSTPVASHLASKKVIDISQLAPTSIYIDSDLPAGQPDVKLTSGFECSRDLTVTKLSPSHYELKSHDKVPTGGFYLLARIEGTAGRTVEIDLVGSPFMNWGNSVPQYSYIRDLGQLAGFESADKSAAPDRPRSATRPALPSTRGQSWHYFDETWKEEGRLCLRQHFDQDAAYIALRVPYTPAYNQAFLARLAGNPHARILTIGQSKRGRPLNIVQIPADAPDDRGRCKPCILMYAREHPDEQDSSWIVQGAIQFIASDVSEAADLRKRFTFLFIPVLDPDGASAGIHANIIASFAPGRETPESLAYASWFKEWVDNGNRLDLALAIHNPTPGAAFNVACPSMEPSIHRLAECKRLHAQVREALTKAGFSVRVTPWSVSRIPERLSGWLATYYGTLAMPYEVNSLTPKQQLNLAQLRDLGRIIATSSAEYLASDPAKDLLTSLDEDDRLRRKAWADFKHSIYPATNPIQAEEWIRAQAAGPSEIVSTP